VSTNLLLLREWSLAEPGVADSEDILKQKGFKVKKAGTSTLFSKEDHHYIKSSEFGVEGMTYNWSHYHKGMPEKKIL